MAQEKEKRRYPRVRDNKISLKLKTEQFDTTISQSLNISASGVYCKVDKELPLLLFRYKMDNEFNLLTCSKLKVSFFEW